MGLGLGYGLDIEFWVVVNVRKGKLGQTNFASRAVYRISSCRNKQFYNEMK